MIMQKPTKTQKSFLCELCTFECCNKKDYNRHLLTAKHKMITNDNNNTHKNPTKYECICYKQYKYASGLSRHKLKCKDCNNNNNDVIFVEEKSKEPVDNSIIINLITQNKELMEMLRQQNNTIQELIPKIGNTTNNTNNAHFNIQLFLNEDCKDAVNFSDFISGIEVSLTDLENQSQIGYVDGISMLFIENLKGLGTLKRPIHCTDAKRHTLYIKENDEWDKEGSLDTLKKGIQEVTRKTYKRLAQEKEDNKEEYENIDSDFSEKCLIIQRNLMPGGDNKINKVIENISQNSTIIENK